MQSSGRAGVLVTGATGHLGYHLIQRLNAAGTVPRALVRRPVARDAWGGLRVEPHPGDLERPHDLGWSRALDGVATVYHLAATVSFRPQDAASIDRINRAGTIELARAAAAAGVERFVYVSVAAAAGAGAERRDESSAFNLDELRVPYIQSKRAAERWLLDQGEADPAMPEIVVANPSLLVGPPLAVNRRTRVSGLSRRALAGLLQFYIDGRLNLVDVRDVAGAIVRLGEHGRPGERYLLTGSSVTIRELFDALAEFVPLGRLRVRLPRRGLLWGAKMASWIEAGRNGSPSPDAAVPPLEDCFRLLDYTWDYSTEKARREIGFTPTPLRETIAHLFQCARSEGMLAS